MTGDGAVSRSGLHPVLLFALTATIMIVLAVISDSAPPWPPWWSRGPGLGLMLLGTIWNLIQARTFRRAKTTLRPGQAPSQLVTTGAYAVSRNPMYLGQLVILIGLAGLLHAWATWPLPLLAALAFDRLVIPAEESRIATALPGPWADYQQRVRRWLGACKE